METNRQGGNIGLILIILLAGATLLTAGVILSGRVSFKPYAAKKNVDNFQKSYSLGLSASVENGVLHISWNKRATATSWEIVVRNEDKNKILTPPDLKIENKKDLASYDLNLPQTEQIKKISIILRANHDILKTTYFEIKNFNISYIPSPSVAFPPPQAKAITRIFPPFGMAGYVDVNVKPGSTGTGYAGYFYKSGAKLINNSVHWKDIEPAKGAGYKFNPKDSSFGALMDGSDNLCHKNGFECAILFDSPPDWATEKARSRGLPNSPCLPIDEEDFDGAAKAVSALIQKLGDKYVGLEFISEPDLANCYGGKDDLNANGKPDFEDYATLLKKIYATKPANSKNYSILMGGLASDPIFDQSSSLNKDLDGSKINQIDFLPQILNYSQNTLGGQFFDALNLHYYESQYEHLMPPFNPADPYSPGGIRGKSLWAKNLLAKYGAAGKPIIYSEVGAATHEPANDLEKRDQAASVFKIYASALSVSDVHSVSWYCLGDLSVACANSVQNFSLRLLDGTPDNKPPLTPRPAYIAYQRISSQLASKYFSDLDQTSGIEGYIFQDPITKEFSEVLWSRSTNLIRKTFPAKQVSYLGLNNVPFNILDGVPKETSQGSIFDLDRVQNSRISFLIGEPVIISWK